LFLALILVPMLSPATWADDAPHRDRPIETVAVSIEGSDYSFGYRAYPAPLVLDLAQASGAQDTPYHTLLSYHRALSQVTDHAAEIAPFLRKAGGEPGAPPPDEAQHNAAARQILSGDILISGEIHLEAYTIFITRYAKSIPRNLGIAIRRFEGPDYVVVQDLILHSPLAKRLSAARWSIEELKAKYPAAQ
jgi:hypothetical protein